MDSLCFFIVEPPASRDHRSGSRDLECWDPDFLGWGGFMDSWRSWSGGFGTFL